MSYNSKHSLSLSHTKSEGGFPDNVCVKATTSYPTGSGQSRVSILFALRIGALSYIRPGTQWSAAILSDFESKGHSDRKTCPALLPTRCVDAQKTLTVIRK